MGTKDRAGLTKLLYHIGNILHGLSRMSERKEIAKQELERTDRLAYFRESLARAGMTGVGAAGWGKAERPYCAAKGNSR